MREFQKVVYCATVKMLTSPRLMFRILLASHFFAGGYLLTSAPKITVNATSGEICFTTSSSDQCSVANLTRYNVCIADITGNLIFKSEDVPESSCVVVNSSTLLISQCGPFKLSALAFDDYNTYEYVHRVINPGFRLKIDNSSNCDLCSCLKANIQLWIFIFPDSLVTSTITFNHAIYSCSTKYITPPEIMFITEINNKTKVKTKICSSDGYIFYTETGYDHSHQLCGYWTFSNGTPFISCPIDCTTKLTILSAIQDAVILTLVLVLVMPVLMMVMALSYKLKCKFKGLRSNISCSFDEYIIDSETGYDYSPHVCGYWTFSNKTLFIGCPINCTSVLTSHSALIAGRQLGYDPSIQSITIVSVMSGTIITFLQTTIIVIICILWLNHTDKKVKGSSNNKRPSVNEGIMHSIDNAEFHTQQVKVNSYCTAQEATTATIVIDKNKPPNKGVVKDLHLLYHTILECGHNGIEHTTIGHNITLRIPKGAIAVQDKIHFQIAVLMFGPFTFPKNTQPISPILWLCPSEDYRMKKPFKIILPHFLSSQAVVKMNSNNVIWFAKAKHDESQTTNEFQFVNSRPLFASSGSRNFAILQIQHFCYYCLIGNKVKDIDIEYCLVQVERPIQQRSEIHFLAIYLLDTCLKAVEQQYPQEDGYNIRHYTTFQFKSGVPAHLEMTIAGQDNNTYCSIALKPNPPKIRERDVDFWKSGTQKGMKLKHERRIYPPRIIVTVTPRNPNSIFILPVKFTGCSEVGQLNVDLSFPLDVSTSRSSFITSAEAESQKILSEEPDLAAAFAELLPVANDWKSIGVLLSVPKNIMDNISEEQKRVKDCLREMLAEWVKRRPTWTDLVEAVKHVNPCISEAIHKRIPKSFKP